MVSLSKRTVLVSCILHLRKVSAIRLKIFQENWIKIQNILSNSALVQKEASAMIPVGHEIAWDQFVLKKGVQKPETPDGNDLAIITSEENITIQNNNTSLSIDSKTGEIVSWTQHNKLITKYPIKPNFWRPPTDNDLGNNMHEWAKIWQDATYNYSSELLEKPENSTSGVTYKVGYQLPHR